MVTLQILFTVISAMLIAAIVPVGIFLGWGWSGACGILAVLFFVLMLLCKQSVAQNAENKQRFHENYISPTKSDEEQ